MVSRQKNPDIGLHEAIARIAERDDRDMRRTLAPLAIPQNSIIIDTTDQTVDHVVVQMQKYIFKAKKGV